MTGDSLPPVSQSDAFVVSQDFPASPEQGFEMPFHYLLYARAGTMTLEADGRRWTLPPARAALIAAGKAIRVTLAGPLSALSALFAPGFAAAPPAPLAVFEMTALARELLAALAHVGRETVPDGREAALFRALVAEAWLLSERPSPAVMPVPGSARVRRALEITEARLEGGLGFAELAGELAMTERSLARHFMAETGMTWREAQRRLRMIRAMGLLAEGRMPVTEVALAVGYSSISAFNAAFRGFSGMTPREFRGR